MTAARKIDSDWEERTAIDTRPATEFAATVSGERAAIGNDDLADLFGEDDEMAELEATRVRDVPSSLLKAASEDAQPATVRTPTLASKSALPTPVAAFDVPAAARGSRWARWRSPEAAAALAFFVLAVVVAAVVLAYTRG